MADVRHTETFNCSPEQFFDLLVDYEKYPEFLNEVQSCQIVSDNDGVKQVAYKVAVIKTFQYTLEHHETRPNEIRWQFMGGDLFKSMNGHWKLSEENGKTLAEYYVEATFGLFVPKAMTKTVLSVNLPAMMKSYHNRVSQLYGV